MSLGKAHAARLRWRAMTSAGTCVYPASVFDPVSARLAEDAGFEVGMVAGSTASLAVLAAPDLMVLTLCELADQCRRIARACGLPLLVDADHGYGGVLNVRRTVEELEQAGVAAITLEDTLLPAPFGASGKSALVSVEEGVAKMRAAVDARGDAALAIVARTSALQITGLADTLVRIRAYEACGVDAVFVVGVKDWDELDQVRQATSLPLLLGNAGAALSDRQRLAVHGVVVCLQGHQPMAAMVQALEGAYRALRAGTSPLSLEGLASPALMRRASRADLHDSWTEHAVATPGSG